MAMDSYSYLYIRCTLGWQRARLEFNKRGVRHPCPLSKYDDYDNTGLCRYVVELEFLLCRARLLSHGRYFVLELVALT